MTTSGPRRGVIGCWAELLRRASTTGALEATLPLVVGDVARGAAAGALRRGDDRLIGVVAPLGGRDIFVTRL
jgi:hypothetical protein